MKRFVKPVTRSELDRLSKLDDNKRVERHQIFLDKDEQHREDRREQ